MKKIRLIAVGMIAALGALFASGMVWAEDGEVALDPTLPVMTLSPMNQQIILTPGGEFHGAIRVSNSASAASNLNYKVSVGSFAERADENSEDDYGVIDTQSVTSYNQIVNWITLDRKSGSVAPNQTDVISFVIQVPESAPAGGQYATILVENVPNRENSGDGEGGEGAGVMIESAVQMASIIYADVAGETHREGVILENKIPTFAFDKTIEATSMIENRGNVHTEAEVLLQVWSAFGGENLCSTKDAGEEGATTTLVLPDTKRFHQETCTLPGAGIYKVKQTVRIFGEESVMEGTLIYLPIWVIVLVVFGIIMAILWFMMMAKNRQKMKQATQ